MQKKNYLHKTLALVMAFLMIVTMMPVNVFATDPLSGTDKKSVEDSIESSVGNDANNAIHAYVGIQVGGDLNLKLQGDALNQQFKPIAGVRAYFQWFEKGGYVSPVYTAVSDAQGRLNIGCKPYVAADGKIIKFDADTTVSGGNEKYRFWIDDENLPKSLKDHQFQYITGENVVFPSDNALVSQGGATTNTPNNTISDMKILFMEKPKAFMHKAKPTETPAIRTGLGSGGTVWGKVTWDYESPSGGVQWGIVATPSSKAKGVKIKASYLSDYAMKEIYSPETARMLSLSSPEDIRGSKWSYALETQLQKWIQEQVKKNPDKWIAETVTTRSEGTNAEGDYKLQFNGTWGPARNKGVYNYTPPALWPQDKKDRIGTVAASPNDGSFAVGIGQDTKHINIDWMFISADDTEDLRLMTPFNNNWFTGTSGLTGNWGIHSGWAQTAFGVTTAVDTNNNIRADFGFGSPGVNFEITNYDSEANTALPGDVAETKTTGLPYKVSSDSFVIVWYDPDGKEVGRGTPQKPNSTGTIASAPLDTSKLTINKTTEYTAKLYRVKPDGSLEAQPIAADSFTVEVSHLFISRYDDVNIPNPKAGDKEMQGATYSATGLPDALQIGSNNGTISGKAKKAGLYKVDFKTTLPDKSGQIEGTRARYIAVTDSPLAAGEVGVAYSQEVKPVPEKDPKGKDYIYKMKSVNFMSGKEVAGLKVEGDATTGFKITGTPTKEAKATEDVLNGDPGPNVEVTYDIYKRNDTGNEVLVAQDHKDKVPLVVRPIVIIPDQDNPGNVPAGYVRVTFKPGEGTFGANDKKVFDVLKGKTIQDAQKANPALAIPTATANDANKEHTAWTADKDYKKDLTDYTTALNANVEFTAKYIDKPAVIVPDPKKPGEVPAGYVRVTFDATKDGKIDGNQFKYVDVRKDVTWDDKAVTDAIPATATYKDATKAFEKWNPDVPTTGAVAEGTYTAQYKDTDKVKTPDPKKPGEVPAGYVRVTFDATKDGKIDGNQFKYVDVRKDVTWDDKAVTDAIPATATYKDATKAFEKWNPDVPTTGAVAEGTYTAQYKDTTPAEKEADKYTPTADPVEKDKGTAVTEKDVTDAVKVPDFKENPKFPGQTPKVTVDDPASLPDGNTVGKTDVAVTVTYPDGSTDKITVPVTIKDTTPTGKEADKYTPTADPVEKDKGTAVTEKDVTDAVKVPDYKENPKFPGQTPKVTVDDPASLPDGNTVGKTDVAVTVTYPDGSKDKLTVPVTIKDTTPTGKEADKYTPTADPVEKDKGTAVTEKDVTDAVKVPDYKENPKFPGQTPKVTVDDPASLPDGNTVGKTDVAVTVTYPDGSTDKITVPVTIKDSTKPSYLTLTLDENYSGGRIRDYYVFKGEPIDSYLYTPHRRGYVFEGWSYNSRRLDEVRPGDGIYYPTILYAIWSKDREYGRRYDRYDRDKREEEPEIVDNRPVGEHKAYMFGYPDGTVRANGKITRAEAAALITRLLGIDALGSDSKPNFPDVPSSWYNKAINAAVQRGIMKGYPDGTFRPNAPITRAEFTQMISTIDNKPYGVAPFADVIGHWAERPIGSEYQAGRIMGYPDGTFRPNAFITRAEAVVILNKIFERNYDAISAMNCPTKGNIKFFIDLDGSFWGYYDMVEATNTHSFKRRVKGNVQEDWVDVK